MRSEWTADPSIRTIQQTEFEMAFRGVKPKPPGYLALVKGTIPEDGREDPAVNIEPAYDNGLEPPRKLSGRQLELWNAYIRKAPWLTEFDVPRAFMWVNIHAEFERKPQKMVPGRIAQLRALGSELGMDPGSRMRLGGEAGKVSRKKDIAETFFE